MLPGRWLCAQVSGGNCRHGTQILETQLGGNTAALSEGKLQPLNGEYLFTTDQDSRHCFMCNCPVSSAVRWYQPYKYATAAGIGSHRHVIRDGSCHAKKTHGHCSTEWYEFDSAASIMMCPNKMSGVVLIEVCVMFISASDAGYDGGSRGWWWVGDGWWAGRWRLWQVRPDALIYFHLWGSVQHLRPLLKVLWSSVDVCMSISSWMFLVLHQ